MAGSDGPTCSSVLRDVHVVPRTSKQTRSLSCIVRVVFCRTSSEIRPAVQGAHPWQGQVSEYVQVTRAQTVETGSTIDSIYGSTMYAKLARNEYFSHERSASQC